MNRLVVFAVIVAAALPAFAQIPEPPPLSRVLIPMFLENLPGRFGSIWRSELIVTNPTVHRVILSNGPPWCVVTGCSDEFVGVDPGVTTFPGGSKNFSHVGFVWFVEDAYEDQLSFFLRLWDSSRNHEDWGTSVPVVREQEFLTRPTELTGAPTDAGFRVTLRVYEPEPTNLTSVRVTFFSVPSPLAGSPVGWRSLSAGRSDADQPSIVLDVRGGGVDSEWPTDPAYAEIADVVAAFPQLLAAERFGVRIEPLTEGMRYWAMLSITHNETQHVTLITPD